MTAVTLPWAADRVVIDLDTCIKTGRRTNETVTLRGSTTPGWVTLLLFLTVIGFLLASFMTSRRYEIRVPFTHAAHDRWTRHRRWAWVVGLTGVAALVAAIAGADAPWVSLTGFGLIVGGVVYGTVNSVVNGVTVRVTRDQQLVISGAHTAFAEAVSNAAYEPLARR